MNLHLDKQSFSEYQCGSNLSYILNDNNVFLPGEYKILQSQHAGTFAKCMKILYNGKIQLLYLTANYHSLSNFFEFKNPDVFLKVIKNLIKSIETVKSNGFLSCNHIDADPDHIYVDPSTLDVYLIYMPVSASFHKDAFAFENSLRTNLIRIIHATPELKTAKTHSMITKLSNVHLKLSDLIAENDSVAQVQEKKVDSVKKIKPRLLSMNAAKRTEILITKDSFVIGKNTSAVDYAITNNAVISRRHCMITRKKDVFYVTDLGSKNGTFLNRSRLSADEAYEIKRGDVLRLANTDFQFEL